MLGQYQRRLRTELILSILLAFLQAGVQGWEIPNCVTPHGLTGYCIPIVHCQTSQWIKNGINTPERRHIENYVRMSYCGHHGTTYYSCCAEHELIRSSANIISTTPKNALLEKKTLQLNGLEKEAVQHNASKQEPFGEELLSKQKCGQQNGHRISHGEQAILGEFPWMVLLAYEDTTSRDRFKCAGTLITDRYVLTAAHCVFDQNAIISVRLGEHDLRKRIDCNTVKRSRQQYCLPPAIDVPVERAVVHEHYDKGNLSNDIAILRLQRPVEFSVHIKPVCLPLANKVSSTPETQVIAGWGLNEYGYASEVLLKTSVSVKNLDFCQRTYRRELPWSAAEKLCVGSTENRGNTCRGDSGGPMFVPTQYGNRIRYTQFGIISSGFSRCDNPNNYPAVLTNVANYMNWIIEQIQQ